MRKHCNKSEKDDDMNLYVERLAKLKETMKDEGVDVCLIESTDFHSSEYVSDYFKVTEYYSGCTSDNVVMVISEDEVCLWTDGRYFISAAKELEGSGIELMKSGEPGVLPVHLYLEKILKQGMSLGFDGRTIRVDKGNLYRKAAAKSGCIMVGDFDPAEDLWEDRPALPAGKIRILPLEFSGEEYKSKRNKVMEMLQRSGADNLVLSKLDDIMWLLNIRGEDIAYNPVALSYLILAGEETHLYLQEASVTEEIENYLKQNDIILHSYDSFYESLAEMKFAGTVFIDAHNTSDLILELLSKKNIRMIADVSPVTKLKAVKNETELKHIRDCYLRDSAVLCRFLYRILKRESFEGVTEYDLAMGLNDMRSTIPDYTDISFETISAYGPNAAIVHYEPKKESAAEIKKEGFLLIDSGGQYESGTTDVTRTVALGPVTEEMKNDFTVVAIANLKLLTAKFKFGCTGANLDLYARSVLWERGLDYNHGTGHGIGYALNVHEGPQNIGFRIAPAVPGQRISTGALTAFVPGMITSDEPGIYREGKYGIRTESIVECVEAEINEFGRFLEFRPLTYVPIDVSALNFKMMDRSDIGKLNAYHKAVYEKISPLLSDSGEKEWLYEVTKPVDYEAE